MATTLGDAKIVVKLEIPGVGGVPGTAPAPASATPGPGVPGSPGDAGRDGRDGGEGRYAPAKPIRERDDVPGGDDDPLTDTARAAGRGLKAAYGGGLYGEIVGAIPFAGIAIKAAEYGPGVGTAVREAIPGDSPAAAAARQVIESGIEVARTLTNALHDARAFLNATGAAAEGAQANAVLQSQLNGGVNVGDVLNFGVLAFKVREFFERLELAREQRDREALGGGIGDAIRDMTAGAAGR